MASYHFSAQIIKRSVNRSAVAAAAYRAGAKLHDRRTDQTHDYSRRGGVAHAEIMLPEGAAAFLADRETLWNLAEEMENRKDAQIAREINMALPHELTDGQRLELVREFVREQFISRGMAADVAIHAPQPEKGDSPQNYHAHVMLTLRQATAEGLREIKTREWNSVALLTDWRKEWAACQNQALEHHRHKDRVDHRTLKVQQAEAAAQGDRHRAAWLDREPEIHVGPRARQMERQGFTPCSRDRQKPVYSRQRQASVMRCRTYGMTDRGTRAAWNYRIIQQNSQRFGGYVTTWRRRQARFQRHAMRYGRRCRHSPHARRRLSLLERILKDLSATIAFGRFYQGRGGDRVGDYRLRYHRQTISAHRPGQVPQGRSRGRGRQRLSGLFASQAT